MPVILDLERETHGGIGAGVAGDVHGLAVRGTDGADVGYFPGAREVAHNCIHERLDAFVAEGRTAKDRDRIASTKRNVPDRGAGSGASLRVGAARRTSGAGAGEPRVRAVCGSLGT